LWLVSEVCVIGVKKRAAIGAMVVGACSVRILHAFIVKVDGLIAYPATVADEVVLACFGAVRVVHCRVFCFDSVSVPAWSRLTFSALDFSAKRSTVFFNYFHFCSGIKHWCGFPANRFFLFRGIFSFFSAHRFESKDNVFVLVTAQDVFSGLLFYPSCENL